jgi:hypothetical protein
MMSEIFEKYCDKNFRSVEGERGVQNLRDLVETLGYGRGYMSNRSIEDFLTDNPGAIEAILEFVGDWVPRNSDWEDKITDAVDFGD